MRTGSLSKFMAERWSKARSRMNKYPETATTYRGRVLISMHIDFNEHFTEASVPHTKKAKPLPESVCFFVFANCLDLCCDRRVCSPLPTFLFPRVCCPLPQLLARLTSRFTLCAMVVGGSSIPSLNKFLGSAKFSVRVSIGSTHLDSVAAPNNGGQVVWRQMLRLDGIELPTEPSSIPDVFVTLQKGGKQLCYARIKAAELLAESWSGSLHWLPLRRDGVMGLISERTEPGSVLLRLGLGPSGSVPSLRWEAEYERALASSRLYQMRLHVFQARRLPPADADGTSDPYVVVRHAGKKCRTRVVVNTLNPVWYETLVFEDVQLLPLQYAPQLVLQMMDWDRLSKDDLFGRVRVSLSDATVSDKGNPPTPTWHPVRLLNVGKGKAASVLAANPELLLSVQLVPKASTTTVIPRPPSIVPPNKPVFLEITLCVAAAGGSSVFGVGCPLT